MTLPGDVQDGSPSAAYGAARAACQALSDLGEEMFAVCCRHGDVSREGAQEIDVGAGRVVDGPGEVFDGHDIEQAGLIDLGRLFSELPGRWLRCSCGQALIDGVVHLLELGKEGIAANGEDMLSAPERQVSAGP
jgi:hypothetical protein